MQGTAGEARYRRASIDRPKKTCNSSVRTWDVVWKTCRDEMDDRNERNERESGKSVLVAWLDDEKNWIYLSIYLSIYQHMHTHTHTHTHIYIYIYIYIHYFTQLVQSEEYLPPHITIGGTELKATHWFPKLRCTLMSVVKFKKVVDNRLAKASSAFGRLYKRVWYNKYLKKGTKISVYRTIVLASHLYGSKSWVIDTTNNLSNNYVRAASTSSIGVTSSLILKSLKRWKSPAWKLCNRNSSYDALDTFSRWVIIVCRRLYYVASSALTIAIHGLLEKFIWGLFHQASSIVHSSWEPWRLASPYQPCDLLL